MKTCLLIISFVLLAQLGRPFLYSNQSEDILDGCQHSQILLEIAENDQGLVEKIQDSLLPSANSLIEKSKAIHHVVCNPGIANNIMLQTRSKSHKASFESKLGVMKQEVESLPRGSSKTENLILLNLKTSISNLIQLSESHTKDQEVCDNISKNLESQSSFFELINDEKSSKNLNQKIPELKSFIQACSEEKGQPTYQSVVLPAGVDPNDKKIQDAIAAAMKNRQADGSNQNAETEIIFIPIEGYEQAPAVPQPTVPTFKPSTTNTSSQTSTPAKVVTTTPIQAINPTPAPITTTTTTVVKPQNPTAPSTPVLTTITPPKSNAANPDNLIAPCGDPNGCFPFETESQPEAQEAYPQEVEFYFYEGDQAPNEQEAVETALEAPNEAETFYEAENFWETPTEPSFETLDVDDVTPIWNTEAMIPVEQYETPICDQDSCQIIYLNQPNSNDYLSGYYNQPVYYTQGSPADMSYSYLPSQNTYYLNDNSYYPTDESMTYYQNYAPEDSQYYVYYTPDQQETYQVDMSYFSMPEDTTQAYYIPNQQETYQVEMSYYTMPEDTTTQAYTFYAPDQQETYQTDISYYNIPQDQIYDQQGSILNDYSYLYSPDGTTQTYVYYVTDQDGGDQNGNSNYDVNYSYQIVYTDGTEAGEQYPVYGQGDTYQTYLETPQYDYTNQDVNLDSNQFNYQLNPSVAYEFDVEWKITLTPTGIQSYFPENTNANTQTYDGDSQAEQYYDNVNQNPSYDTQDSYPNELNLIINNLPDNTVELEFVITTYSYDSNYNAGDDSATNLNYLNQLSGQQPPYYDSEPVTYTYTVEYAQDSGQDYLPQDQDYMGYYYQSEPSVGYDNIQYVTPDGSNYDNQYFGNEGLNIGYDSYMPSQVEYSVYSTPTDDAFTQPVASSEYSGYQYSPNMENYIYQIYGDENVPIDTQQGGSSYQNSYMTDEAPYQQVYYAQPDAYQNPNYYYYTPDSQPLTPNMESETLGYDTYYYQPDEGFDYSNVDTNPTYVINGAPTQNGNSGYTIVSNGNQINPQLSENILQFLMGSMGQGSTQSNDNLLSSLGLDFGGIV